MTWLLKEVCSLPDGLDIELESSMSDREVCVMVFEDHISIAYLDPSANPPYRLAEWGSESDLLGHLEDFLCPPIDPLS